MSIDQLLPPAVNYDAAAGILRIIDQTRLPNELQQIELASIGQLREAITTLQVRGAPAIGIAAAYGLHLGMRGFSGCAKEEFMAQLRQNIDFLASARPTAVNLRWALERVAKAVEESPLLTANGCLALMLAVARDIEAEDAAACRAIGSHGLTLLKEGDSLLTHCNAGHLATAAYGTALAPIYCALEQGLKLKVYCDETRPLLQGARLTAFELQYAGVDVTLICDNMAAGLMAKGLINSVWVGADRIAANGDTANKTGTLGLAVLAHHFGLPFYVCAPESTIDATMPTGADIIIEQRAPEEITEQWYSQRMAPAGIKVYNPAFDVTPAELITAIITERGIYYPDYKSKITNNK